jgi:hypothetical protein
VQVCCVHVSLIPVQIYYTHFKLAGTKISSGFKLADLGFDPSGQEVFSSPRSSVPSSRTMGTGSVCREKGIGAWLDHPPHLAPRF